MRTMAVALFLVLTSSLSSSSSAEPLFPTPAIEFAPRSYVSYRAAAAPNIDGQPDDPAWQSAPWTQDFVDIEGDLRPAPFLRTRAKMLWDDGYLYVLADIEEPDLWATYTTRDAVIYHENDIEVFIDPDGDTHLYYELEMNALNTVWDLLLVRPYRDGGPAINGWDTAGLRTAVQLAGTLNDPSDRDTGWFAEIAFPWEALKECAGKPVPPGDGDQWRMNFSRVEWRLETPGGRYSKKTDPATGKPLPEYNWVWSPQGLIAMHYPEMWGVVQFSSMNAGSGTIAVRTDPDRGSQWILRLIYYAQKERFARTQGFSNDIAGLRAETSLWHFEIPGELQIGLTPSGFEAVLPGTAGESLHIDNFGRTWKTR